MRNAKGFTLIELLVAISIMAALMGIAVFDFRELVKEAESGAAILSSHFKKSRTRAMSATSAYLVEPVSATRVRARSANTCSSTTWTTDDRMYLDLPDGAEFTSTGWSICFNSRGFPDNNLIVQLDDNEEAWNVEVMLGGATRFYE